MKVRDMKEIIKIGIKKEEEFIFIKMEIFMMENLKTIKRKEKVLFIIITVIGKWEIIQMIKKLENI